MENRSLLVVTMVVCMLTITEAHVNLGTMSRLSKWSGRKASLGKLNLCETCLQLSQEAQVVLSNPNTSKEIISFVDERICNPLIDELQKECEEKVGSYVSETLLELEELLGPDKLCYDSGLCKNFAVHAFKDDQKSCMVCQDLATDALTYLEKNKTRAEIVIALHSGCARLKDLQQQCDLLVDLYTPRMMEQLENITPQEFCQMTRICKPPKSVVAGNDCTKCQIVILELKMKLEDPQTQEKVLAALLNSCNRVQNHVDECKALVVEYGPFVLANLDKILDSQALCCKAGFCKSSICPEKAKLWTETVIALSQKDAPLIELPHEGFTKSV